MPGRPEPRKGSSGRSAAARQPDRADRRSDGSARATLLRCGGGPRHRRPRPAVIAAIAASTSVFGQRPLVAAEASAPGQALLAVVERPAAVDVEQRHADAGARRRGVGSTASTSAAARPLGDDDREVALDRRVARRRVDPWHRRLAAGQPGDRRARRRRPAPARRSSASTTSGWSSPDPPDQRRRRPVTRAARPGWRFGSSVSGAYAGVAQPSSAASSSMRPLASSRSYGRAARSQAGGSAAPVRANPSRHHSCVVGPSGAP